MIAAHYRPGLPLSLFVDQFWCWDGYVQPHARERLLPTGSVTVVFNLLEDRTGFCDPDHPDQVETKGGQVFAGPRSTAFVVETRHMCRTVGVQFKSGGAFPFLPFPVTELAEQCVSLEEVFHSSGRSIREQLLAAESSTAIFSILERWLMSRLTHPLERHPAVAYALSHFEQNPASGSVAEVLDRVGYSQRHFINLFATEVGLTPKLFARVQRFQRVLRSISTQVSVDWADTALAWGYYDQAHFAHDFKQFAGLTPEMYLRFRTPHLNHVPMTD